MKNSEVRIQESELISGESESPLIEDHAHCKFSGGVVLNPPIHPPVVQNSYAHSDS